MDALIPVAVILVVIVGYRISLTLWPYTRCPKCEGSGRNSGSNRSRWGTCRKCRGSGRRKRLGVRLFLSNQD